MLTLITRKITKNKRERTKKAEVQQMTKRVKIRDKVRKEITKAIIKVIKVIHNPRQYKAPLTSGRLTLVLLRTISTLIV
jgi:hypothetical protein